MKKLLHSILFAALLVGLSAPAFGAMYNVQTNLNNYGLLNQNDPLILPVGIGAVACVPVAVTNSLVYLENTYPGVYSRGLVPDNNPANGLIDNAEMAATASTLAGANYMNTKILTGGTWQDMAIYGKHKYIEDNVPGVTIYAAQMSGTWAWAGRPVDETPPIAKPAWVQDQMFPEWQFLFNNLLDGEDVEICINEGDWGHCLTLTSFHWNDADDDGIIDAIENATIDFIDPALGAWVAAKSIWQGALSGPISVNYSVTYPAATLKMAMKESVPEPSTLVLLGAGVIGLLVYVWRRKRAM